MKSLLHRWLALGTLPHFCGCQAAFFGAVNTSQKAIVAQTRTYSTEYALDVDIYRPSPTSAATPVALFFYGGSWRRGSRSEYAFVGKALAARGVLTLVADYRKFPQAPFPGFENDAAQATRWTFDHAREFGGDPARVFLVGHSAGSQIVGLLATDGHYLAAVGRKPRDLAGVVGIAGPYDFLPLTDPKLVEVFGPESQWPASQPIRFVDGDEPPFLLLHGDGDRVVEPRNSRVMAARLESVCVPVTYKRYPGIGHFRILGGLSYSSSAPTLGDVVDYIFASPEAVAGKQQPRA
jgi:acetyl esterase/lipase